MAIAEIVCIGTELLLGQILNTNSQYLAQELADLGLGSYFQSTVGDNQARMQEAYRLALSRSDVVITTGGLGPTADDLTHEAWEELFGVGMDFDPPTLERIDKFFQSRGLVMPETNRKQAMRPRGADILPNPRGTAPGIIWKIEPDLLERIGIASGGRPRYVLTFPGVPSEMKAMWLETGKPFLAATFGPGVVWSCELKHYGIGESAMAEKYASLLDLQNPTVAPLAGRGECRLRVTARARTVDEARALAAPIIEKIERESGSFCYGRDADTLAVALGRMLSERGLTLSVAESCTGGLVSKQLTDVPGSSKYTKLNVVTYANEAKAQMLKVSESLLAEHGAVSQECAEAMARGVRELSGSDIGLSITGIAGPDGGTTEKPVGLVYMAVATARGVESRKHQYPQNWNRSDVRHRSASDALNLVRQHLLGASS